MHFINDIKPHNSMNVAVAQWYDFLLIFDRPRVQIPDGTKNFFFVNFCHIYLAWSGMWYKGKSCTPVTNLKINVIQVSKWRKNWLIIVCILQEPLWITPWRLLSCKKRVHSLKIKEKSFLLRRGFEPGAYGLWAKSFTVWAIATIIQVVGIDVLYILWGVLGDVILTVFPLWL